MSGNTLVLGGGAACPRMATPMIGGHSALCFSSPIQALSVLGLSALWLLGTVPGKSRCAMMSRPTSGVLLGCPGLEEGLLLHP